MVASAGSCLIDQPYSAASPQASRTEVPGLYGPIPVRLGVFFTRQIAEPFDPLLVDGHGSVWGILFR
jgi:hypothetical protein